MTTVEWLEIEIKKFNTVITREYLLLLTKQAIEMEKQQIMMAWHNGKINEQDFFSDHTETIVRANCAEQYYNETYKK